MNIYYGFLSNLQIKQQINHATRCSIIIMEYLPKDPAILVSSINMLLRDEEFDSLESLCYSFSREPEEIKDYLLQNEYVYSEEQRQFRPVGFDA